jgi:hypothetical protein
MNASIESSTASEQRDPASIARWARVALTVVLLLVGWKAFHDEYGYVPLLGDINLAVHEFGHILFMPFGDTMTILGGSLTQVLFPLVFLAYFSRRDPHAATVCLWWAAINVLSVAIYCADARAGELMLITGQTGQESDAHDWNNLLTHWGLLKRDLVIAARMRAVAWLLFWTSIAGGVVMALRTPKPQPVTEA